MTPNANVIKIEALAQKPEETIEAMGAIFEGIDLRITSRSKTAPASLKAERTSAVGDIKKERGGCERNVWNS